MKKAIVVFLVMVLIVIPPIASWWIADYLHVRPMDASIIIWLLAAYPIWIALIAAIVQIFGYDVRSIIFSENRGMTEVPRTSPRRNNTKQHDSNLDLIISELSNNICSPYSLAKILAFLVKNETVNFLNIQERFHFNRFILLDLLNKLCEKGLLSQLEDDITITERGKLIYSYLSDHPKINIGEESGEWNQLGQKKVRE